DTNITEEENNSFYTLINNDNAGVTAISDTGDNVPLEIAQAIPSVSGQQYPLNAPIVYFFNDKLLLSSINEDSFIVKENGVQVRGVISLNEASNGYAILTFTPDNS